MCVYSLKKKQYCGAMKELSQKRLGAAAVVALIIIAIGLVLLLMGNTKDGISSDKTAAIAVMILGAAVLLSCVALFIAMNVRVRKSWKYLSDGEEQIIYRIELKPGALCVEVDGFETVTINSSEIKSVTTLKNYYIIISKKLGFPLVKGEETEEVIAMLNANGVKIK